MTKLVFRPHQKIAISFILKTKRGNVFLSPGMGKTISVLYSLSCLKLLEGYDDSFPVLIVAPKKVANSVWDEEIRNWKDLNNLSISKVLGNAKEREKSLKIKADIYVINYENLVWLLTLLGNSFPFKTVVCDESTKIKGHRVSAYINARGEQAFRKNGSKNASCLVRRSVNVNRWYNLSGTPTPKGVIDLWAQQFPIDLGSVLKPCFTDFLKQWFRLGYGSTPQKPRWEPYIYAEDEILELIKPNTLMMDAYDWLDVSRPVEIDIRIELPKVLQKRYNTLQSDAVLTLDDTDGVMETKNKMSKCSQFASGSVLDEDKVPIYIHDFKIQALKDLVDSLEGQPLIVAYHFRHDKASILRHFKQAVELPSGGVKQREVEDKWNAGKVPMLILHPQSAGHGLNLQRGGNNMCIFTPDWNAEYYDQVIERIGPVRQAQSGFKRLTYIHRLVMAKTIDEAVMANLKGKFINSQSIREYLKT